MASLSNIYLEVDFGKAHGGLATVGYRLYKNDGTDSVAFTTTGVFEIVANEGAYGVVVPSIPDDAVGIEWSTGGGTPVYARQSQSWTDKFLQAVNGGRWRINKGTDQLELYDEDNTTLIATFDLYDVFPTTSHENVFERRRV